MPTFPLYLQIEDSAQPAAGAGIWDELQSALNVQGYIPVRADGIISKEMNDKTGRHFMLKNGKTHSYARLSPEEFWLWEQMDGAKTVQKLVLAYFAQYKDFAFAAVVALVERLREANMLQEAPRHTYAEVAAAIQKQSFWYKFTWLGRAVFTKEFVVKNLDVHLTRIHRYGGWLIYTIPAQILILLVSAIGTGLFFVLARDPRYNLLSLDTAVQLGFLSLLPILLHEFSHGLTAKHFGCEVYKGGAMLYYGMPAAFMDTTDVWMFGKRARLAVTWAGPYTGYIIGGACSLIVYFSPTLPLETAVLLLQLALSALFINTWNLLPVLKLDGYYILADWLEIPRLRERSMEFLARELQAKLKSRSRWTRDEKIFLVYGVVAFLSTFYFTYVGVAFWDRQATRSFSELLNLQGDFGAILINVGMLLLAASTIVYSFIFIAGSAKTLVEWLRKKGLLSTRGRAALLLAFAALVILYLPRYLLPTLWFSVELVASCAAFLLGAWLAFNNYRAMRGSVHARLWFFAALGLLLGAASLLWKYYADGTGLVLHAAAAGIFLLGFLLAGSLPLNLNGVWRGSSLLLLLFGFFAWAGSLAWFIQYPFAILSLNWHIPAGFLLLGGVLHWNMRPPESEAQNRARRKRDELRAWLEALDLSKIKIDPRPRSNMLRIESMQQKSAGGTNERMARALAEIKRTILLELELDFGNQTRACVEFGMYSPTESAGETRPPAALDMTPNDYGGALALDLEELLVSVERAAGKKYAWRALASGFDRLDWEIQELIEDHVLKYTRHAAGLSNELTAARNDLDILLRSVPLFISLTEEDLSALAKRFVPQRFERGEEIVRAGDSGDSFYVIRVGRAEVLSADGERLNNLGRGDYFGEASLLTGAKRNATIRALTSIQALALSKRDFDKLIRANVKFDEKSRDEFHRLNVLRQIPLFEHFEGLDLKMLAATLQKIEARQGQIVFEQGAPGDCFYVVEAGKVSVQIDGVERAVLGAGEYFGEMALTSAAPRTATVSASAPTTLLQLAGEDFQELTQVSSGMKQALERASSRRALINRRRASNV
ncbi:MAG: hypothetical protein DCC59_10640 [Chloroflexi bacterium]|nr:cyclic nucleotide-binding domain-containing protein [Anaerolineales bacterium]RIK52272.1 MAG: hypothetical protein DCC59_10640 [Chloroflexota bacterium]